jgi:hypothetical protein
MRTSSSSIIDAGSATSTDPSLEEGDFHLSKIENVPSYSYSTYQAIPNRPEVTVQAHIISSISNPVTPVHMTRRLGQGWAGSGSDVGIEWQLRGVYSACPPVENPDQSKGVRECERRGRERKRERRRGEECDKQGHVTASG